MTTHFNCIVRYFLVLATPFMLLTSVDARARNHLMRQYEPMVRAAALRHGIDQSLLLAIVYCESSGNPEAISSADARGIAQLMIRTARMMRPNEFIIRSDLHDPEYCLDIAAEHIRVLREQVVRSFPRANLTMRVRLIAAAYNAGWGAVKRAGGVPKYRETKIYVRRVEEHYFNYRNGTPSKVKSHSRRETQKR